MRFELLVAVRYLRARRKQAVISLITLISIVGVAAGVAALIIALAINEGFTEDLQQKLLGAQAHIRLIQQDNTGIADYVEVAKRVEKVEGVIAAAPSVYDTVLISTGRMKEGVALKGIIPDMESRISAFSRNITKGSVQSFDEQSIVLGQDLSNAIGASVGDVVEVLSAQTTLTPVGAVPKRMAFHVIAIFSSGLYDLDSKWVYVSMASAQRLLNRKDVATTIEVKVGNIYDAKVIGQRIVDSVGPGLAFEDWMTLNKPIFQALSLEKIVMFITIGLIVMVAALNIVATLIMMVLEKTRDIAILMSMGATQANIRRVFILQGVIIGVVGTFIGVLVGNVASVLADRYHLISLAPDVYTIPYVPFHVSFMNTAIVAVTAILISFLATLYPSAAASRLRPVEALRYE